MIQPKKFDAERRTTIRKNCMIPVDYVVNRRAYRDFIENISQQGVFIGTKRPVSPGTELVLTFTWKQTGQFIKSSGIVIRKNRKGFAVIFPQPLAIQ
jgi:hypothetical protein